MKPIEHRPGEAASRAGKYHERNVLGAPTGKVIDVQKGEELPSAPRGFTWQHAPKESD